MLPLSPLSTVVLATSSLSSSPIFALPLLLTLLGELLSEGAHQFVASCVSAIRIPYGVFYSQSLLSRFNCCVFSNFSCWYYSLQPRLGFCDK